MFIYLFLVLASGGILSSIIAHLGQSPLTYYDFVATAVVLGGTLTVGLALIPWEYRTEVAKAFRFLFKKEDSQFKSVVELAHEAFEKRSLNPSNLNHLYTLILRDGLEYLQLGIPKERVLNILDDQIHMHTKRLRRIGIAIKNLSKYPPAFGLIGTVFGLVNIMKHLETASDASKLGGEMSIALFATMYGLLVANFIVSPMAEYILKKVDEEEEYAHIALEAVSLLAEQVSTVEFVEHLNAQVPPEQRQNIRFQTDMAA